MFSMLVAVLIAVATQVSSAQLGEIEVTITDREHGNPIPGASAVLTDRNSSVGAGLDGVIRIEGLKPQPDTLFIQSIGYHMLSIPVSIKQDTLTRVEAILPLAELENIQPYLCIPEQEKLLREYEKKNTKITFVPITRAK